MQQTLIALALGLCLSFSALAQAPAAQSAPAQAPARPAVAQDKNKLSYAMGFQLGSEISGRKVDVDIATVIRGLQDGFAKKEPTVSKEDMAAQLEVLGNKMREQAMAEFTKVAAENKAKSATFLAQAKTKKGVVALPSGILYRVIDEGNGARPTKTSEVTVHYRGQLMDGFEFDSSYSRNQPVSFKVDEVLKGWQEVLPLMKTGDRWEVYLPPEQAYGERGSRGIGPNEVLVFDIKLVGVK
jgi:FKBP-type peptidyl-prolyl cis-trans isomerase FklB